MIERSSNAGGSIGAEGLRRLSSTLITTEDGPPATPCRGKERDSKRKDVVVDRGLKEEVTPRSSLVDVRRQRACGYVESRLRGRAMQKMFRRVRPAAQGARDNGDRRQCSMHPSGRHKTIQMDAEECPPLGLGGGARAFIKALSEGSGVPAFVLDAVTQIGTPHGGFVLLQYLIKDALDGR